MTDNTSDNSGSSNVLIDFAFVTTPPTGGPTPASSSTSQTNETTDIMIQLDSATDDLMVGIATLPATPASISVDEATEDYVWSGGLCTSNKDCYPKMRESLTGSDVETIGVDISGCYADSRVDSFEECQGGESCMMALCYEDSCRGRSAYCSESGLCMLHEQKNAQSDDSMLVEVVPSDVDLGVDEIDITEMSVPIMSSWCTFDTIVQVHSFASINRMETASFLLVVDVKLRREMLILNWSEGSRELTLICP